MRALRAWLQASRLASQSYIALPILLGQALFAASGGDVDLRVLVLAQLFGLFDQLYIVWANDYADRETDLLNGTPTIFSGGSRVLVEGKLTPAALLRAAIAAAALMMVVTLVLAIGWQRWALVPLALAAIALLWLYSYPPVRLSYRGGGELLQMLGVGLVLPLYGWIAQGGALGAFPWPALAVLLPANLACALATTLPDEPSDRASDKRTTAVTLGGATTSFVITALLLAATATVALTPWMPKTWLGALRDLVPFTREGPLAQLGPLAPGLALPVIAALAHAALVKRGPGTMGMNVRVALAITAALALQALMLAAAWSRT
ncbi:prenyltransferase [Myxococcota bacterium]|nr:prenyltransferase [Myxococcota bacterium]